MILKCYNYNQIEYLKTTITTVNANYSTLQDKMLNASDKREERFDRAQTDEAERKYCESKLKYLVKDRANSYVYNRKPLSEYNNINNMPYYGTGQRPSNIQVASEQQSQLLINQVAEQQLVNSTQQYIDPRQQTLGPEQPLTTGQQVQIQQTLGPEQQLTTGQRAQIQQTLGN